MSAQQDLPVWTYFPSAIVKAIHPHAGGHMIVVQSGSQEADLWVDTERFRGLAPGMTVSAMILGDESVSIKVLEEGSP